VSRHHKVEELLNGREVEDLEAFAREPGRTVDECHQWVLERGYTLARSSVGRWKQTFDEQISAERFAKSGAFARVVTDAGREAGGVAIAEATLSQVGQVLFEQSMRLQADGAIPTADLVNITNAIKTTVATRQGIEKLKAEFAERDRKAIEQAERAATSGKSASDVIAVMKAALGIAA
jgi:hypothetical protein